VYASKVKFDTPMTRLYLRCVDMATPGLISAKLVTVEIVESGASNERICVLFSKAAACLPGAELISERFFSTIGAPMVRGRMLPLTCCGTSRIRCQPEKDDGPR